MVITLGIFHLQPTAQQEQFLAAVEATTALFNKQKGFVRRVVSKNEHGQWADLVYWTSREAAEQAASSFMTATEAQQFLGVLVPEGLHLFHFQMMVEEQ